MNTQLYPYAEGDLLTDRNRYSYTPFVGEPLLEGWRSSREAVLAQCPASVSAPQSRLEETYHPNLSAQQTSTADLMEWAVGRLDEHEASELLNTCLWNLMDRFENVKRFHAHYNERFRACDKNDYLDLELYVRGAEVFQKAYLTANKLPYLNVLLKVVDTLCALHDRLDEHQQGRLSNLIEEERRILEQLAIEFEKMSCQPK